MPWQFTAALLAREAMLLVALAVLRRYGYGPPPVHYLGKTATFILLAAFPVLLLAHGRAGRRAGGRARSAGAWPGGASVLYWIAGVLYVGQVAAAGARGRGRGERRRRRDRRQRRGPARRRRRSRPDFLTELFRNPLDPGYADAAARRAAARPARRLAARRRLRGHARSTAGR